MPELPEVETIRLGLKKYIVGYKVVDVEVRLKKMVHGEVKNIIGAKVQDVQRFGKGLVIDFDNGYSIAAHIKLTGQFIYRGSGVQIYRISENKVGGELPNKWTHVIFRLGESVKGKAKRDSGTFLYYNDVRQFGWIRIVQSSKLKDQSFFKELGPEFLKDLTIEKFKEIVSKANSPIKPLLMDQKKMSGVGNIYANDALFYAKIDPRTKAKTLTDVKLRKLYDSILHVLKEGLKYGGATELNFVNALGQEGKYQDHFLVYGREKEPCRVCKTPIKKFKLAGRGTYFCPVCQV
ncbi:MAG: bifunctional DNA-formamidopyrimidine glycosylase/DNA-(apurinic or apyrimidinic site) lyase [Candidatus Levybacteria bacterium]|nr:bifunctional DNA-formamidopyrimidine glycosylase/DNA-(apurinic or apyrimidinic site) lyase [Candidatus Levybacteria bacterium]